MKKFFDKALSFRTHTQKTRILSVLDIGSSKIACMIVRLTPCNDLTYLYGRTHQIEILGFGCRQSSGIKNGIIVDLDKAEQAIRSVVDIAERMAGLFIDSLIVNIPSSCVKSSVRRSHIMIAGEVTEKHLEEGLRQIIDKDMNGSSCVLQVLPLRYYLDNTVLVEYPIGMAANSLGIDVHVLTVDSAPLRNLELCINRAHLSVQAVVPSSFASGISSLMADEARLGAVCIDMGAGTTEAAVFIQYSYVFCYSWHGWWYRDRCCACCCTRCS